MSKFKSSPRCIGSNTKKRSSGRGVGAKGANGTRRKVVPLSEILNMNVPQDKFMLCLGGFLLVAVCLAGYGVVLASRMEMNSPIDVKNNDQRIIKMDTF